MIPTQQLADFFAWKARRLAPHSCETCHGGPRCEVAGCQGGTLGDVYLYAAMQWYLANFGDDDTTSEG
jgi:hypothetical protein